MEKSVLVAYASKYGSTAEIAEKIKQVISGKGLKVKIAEVTEVHDLEDHTAVILGSSVYIGRWRKDAVRFMKVHEKELSDKKVWIFSTGPTGKGNPVELLGGWEMPASIKEVVSRIQPEDITVFHGALDPDKLNRVQRFMISKVKAPVGDFRDWEQITSWAEKIADRILE